MHLQIMAIIFTVVIAHFLALISPGPDFLMLVRSSLRNTKKRAIGVAAGIASANGVYVFLCIVGVGSILAASLLVMTILKICGGMYLLYVALQALRSRRSDYAFVTNDQPSIQPERQRGFWEEYISGFLSGISNPKNIIFYLSLFSLVLTNEVSLAYRVALGIWMTVAVFVWDSLIVVVLTQRKVRTVFGRVAFYLDKIAGTLLGLIGIKLIESAVAQESRA